MVVLDLEGVLGEPPALFDLPVGAEVDDRDKAEISELGAVALVEPSEPVGTEEVSPPDAASSGARVSTEVAEVHASRQRQLALRVGKCVGHRPEATGAPLLPWSPTTRECVRQEQAPRPATARQESRSREPGTENGKDDGKWGLGGLRRGRRGRAPIGFDATHVIMTEPGWISRGDTRGVDRDEREVAPSTPLVVLVGEVVAPVVPVGEMPEAVERDLIALG